MRMRKKKYLEERLAECDNIIKLFSDDRNFLTAIEKKEYIDTEALFGNSNPVVLEVGCGKGKFACGGMIENITWSKESDSKPMVFTMENGEPLQFGIGPTYICFIGGGASYGFE